METQTKEKLILPKGERESKETKGRGFQEGELVCKPKIEAESLIIHLFLLDRHRRICQKPKTLFGFKYFPKLFFSFLYKYLVFRGK